LVSIIITSYNYARFLPAAIESALAQRYPQIEVLVVDDGSMDRSREIIAQYQSKNGVVPVLKEHGGEASAMNAGFARSQGAIVIFLDSDDVLSPDIVQRVVDVFATRRNIAKVQYRMAVIDANGAVTGALKPPAYTRLASGGLRHTFLKTFEYRGPPTSGTAFSARALRAIFPIPEDIYRNNTDLYLQNIIMLTGKIVSLDEIGAYYRIHGSNNYDAKRTTIAVMKQDVACMIDCHARVKAHCRRIGLRGCPERGELLVNSQLFIKKLAIAKLEGAGGFRTLGSVGALTLRGISLSFRHPHWTVRQRLLNGVWFGAVAVAPPALALRLVRVRLDSASSSRLANIFALLIGGRRAGGRALRRPAARAAPVLVDRG
jgi:glycosyltransferase involved in cell wall biosynthesis